MTVLGPLLDLENPNKFVWLRSFPSLDERERMRNAFYEGPVWKDELEAIAMPMLESYDVILCETSSGCIFDGPRVRVCGPDRLCEIANGNKYGTFQQRFLP